MRFSFTPEQEEFRSSLRRALEARSPTKEVRRLMETDQGFERDGWKKLNQELGLTAIRIPEAYGGDGFGFGDLAIVLEEMGRGAALRALLVDGAGRQRHPECRHRGSRSRRCCRASPPARRPRPSPAPRMTGAGDAEGIGADRDAIGRRPGG